MKLKKILLLIAAAVISISAFGLTASAVTGSGTDDDPYLISNAEEFKLIHDFPKASFRLTNNIVLNEKYTSSYGFSGTLDGDGYLVVGVSGVAPFYTNSGTIKNLIVQLDDISGAFCAFIYSNEGTIENSGILDGEVTGRDYCGTFVGKNEGTIKNCFSTTQLTVAGGSSTYNKGGFVGYNAGTIEKCYYTGDIYCKGTTSNGGKLNPYVGPFVGGNKASSSQYLDDGGKVISCFYNEDNACGSLGAAYYSGGGWGYSTIAMKMQTLYSKWDFDNVWAMDSSKNDGYPYLQIDRRFGGKPDTTPTPTPTAAPTAAPTTPTTAPAPDGALITASSVNVSPGDTAEVKIKLSGCKGFSNIGIQVGYDTDALTLTSVTNNPSVGSTYTSAQEITANPYNMSWNSATSSNTFNGTLVTLTFKAKDNAAEGKYPITVSYYTGRGGSYTDGVDVNYDIDHNPLGLSYTDGAVVISEHIPGDINGDGSVSDWDGTVLLRYLAGWDNLDINFSALDINGDGTVSDWDGTLLLRYLAGWDVEIQ